MRDMGIFAQQEAARIETETGVRITLGEPSYCHPAPMNEALIQTLSRTARELAVPTQLMASGARHDAAVFAEAGVPAAMLFIRNDGGSHNPLETMALADFNQACRVLAAALVETLAIRT